MAGEVRHVAGGAIAAGPEPSVEGKEGRAPRPAPHLSARHGPRAAFAPVPSAAGAQERSGQEGSPPRPKGPHRARASGCKPVRCYPSHFKDQGTEGQRSEYVAHRNHGWERATVVRTAF